jgi:DNA-directed RNA polymerase specialized sigma24 family protein
MALPPEVRSELVEFGYVHFEAAEVAAAMGVSVEELLQGQLRLEIQ